MRWEAELEQVAQEILQTEAQYVQQIQEVKKELPRILQQHKHIRENKTLVEMLRMQIAIGDTHQKILDMMRNRLACPVDENSFMFFIKDFLQVVSDGAWCWRAEWPMGKSIAIVVLGHGGDAVMKCSA